MSTNDTLRQWYDEAESDLSNDDDYRNCDISPESYINLQSEEDGMAEITHPKIYSFEILFVTTVI